MHDPHCGHRAPAFRRATTWSRVSASRARHRLAGCVAGEPLSPEDAHPRPIFGWTVQDVGDALRDVIRTHPDTGAGLGQDRRCETACVGHYGQTGSHVVVELVGAHPELEELHVRQRVDADVGGPQEARQFCLWNGIAKANVGQFLARGALHQCGLQGTVAEQGEGDIRAVVRSVQDVVESVGWAVRARVDRHRTVDAEAAREGRGAGLRVEVAGLGTVGDDGETIVTHAHRVEVVAPACRDDHDVVGGPIEEPLQPGQDAVHHAPGLQVAELHQRLRPDVPHLQHEGHPANPSDHHAGERAQQVGG